MTYKNFSGRQSEASSKLERAFHLETEMRTFERILPELLKTSPGKFVVINSRNVLGIERDYPSALKVGYEKCGSEKPFFVELIESPEISDRKCHILMTKLECIK